MSDNCTDSSNEEYELYWFNYFVSIGYIDNSDLVNIYAPYGKCTRSSLWITYLINIIHFFLLSSGVLYLLSRYRNQSGLWWPFITWISSFIFLLAAVILFVFLNLNIKLFSILIIAFQLSALIILSISIFIVVKFIFGIEYRYQRCLFFFIIILFLIQIGCFIGQVLITLHCLFNLKFISTFLDYSYWSAIIAAIGTIVSTLLLDHIFMWDLKQERSSRVRPAPMVHQNKTRDRVTSPVDPIILDHFHRQPKPPIDYVYSNSDRTRHFRIQPADRQLVDERSNVMQLEDLDGLDGKQRIHNNLTTSEA